MTLSSRHRIRNSSPGGLRPSTLPLGHGGSPQYYLLEVKGLSTYNVEFALHRVTMVTAFSGIIRSRLNLHVEGSKCIIYVQNDEAVDL